MKRSSVVTTMPYIESNFNEMNHFAGGQSRPTKRTPVILTFLPHPDQKQRRTINCKMDCTAIKEAISPKTLNKFTFALAIVWIVVGATLCIAFAELEISESRDRGW